jgi:anthranilate/para-aminobenzoate synthase component II
MRFKGRIPALGVCLGHQAIGHCHAMTVRRNDVAVHGKTSEVLHDGRGVFAGLPNPMVATRYHSLVIDPDTVHPPPGAAPLEGVQFHPESFLTEHGPALLANFLRMRPAAVTPSA